MRGNEKTAYEELFYRYSGVLREVGRLSMEVARLRKERDEAVDRYAATDHTAYDELITSYSWSLQEIKNLGEARLIQKTVIDRLGEENRAYRAFHEYLRAGLMTLDEDVARE